MEKIRVAFIGMDHVHVQTLANDFVKYPDRIDIVGIADYPSHNPDTWQNKKKLNALGINYLINIGPDHLGRFPLEAQEILRGVVALEENEGKDK